MRSASRRLLVTASTVAVALSLSSLALAQSSDEGGCATDAECADGLVCRVVGSGGTCSAPACPDGETCDVAPVCETVEYRECVAPPCAADADCGDGFTCVVPEDGSMPWCEPKECTTDDDCGDASLKCLTETWQECTGTAYAEPACAPGEDCVLPDPIDPVIDCTTETRSFCGPKYLADCETADDCGEGFDCVPAERCDCAGSAVTPATDSDGSADGAGGAASSDPPPDAGDPMPPPEESCACEPTGTNYCEAQEILCEDDAECPEGWSCVQYPTSDIACDPATDCVLPEPPPSQCEPEWSEWGSIALDGEAGTSDPRADPETAQGGATSGDEEGGAATDEDGSASPEDSAAANDSNDSAKDDSGCQIALAGRPGGSALGLLLGLVGLGALRRRR